MPDININPQQARIIIGTIAAAVFFFIFLYFSLNYTVLILLSELFFVVVIVNLLNRTLIKSEGLFQNETSIYLELGLAVFITIILNQLGISLATNLILVVGVLFIGLLIFTSIKGFSSLVTNAKKSQNITYHSFQGRGLEGTFLKTTFTTAIVTAEFIGLFFLVVTYPLLVIASILFFSFIISALVTGNNLDNKKALAFLLVALFIIFTIQQLSIYGFIPKFTTPSSLLNIDAGIFIGVAIFIFYYAFARIGLVKGENTSMKVG